ncbi:[SSU ribosomal protein S5P]-alanine acetyltransferase [Asanoa ferruginea]|uniref:[SSU ribosomal protein S5P]-alanine acetyltransferase n=1 Tax=Asanoa ferruginea TaxID=53367 RepID=A0A3D9ZNC9_9ACTN|nr:GNAT family protein [Asanoa ferruginea]REF98369.1 [SSU ribosomal protein S5P]-alanine acetyltransferase [Asanoa ferruginea]GIF51254.1 ribosomal protein S5 alanine N-acetyltransferase [Asanoa ferruginea]
MVHIRPLDVSDAPVLATAYTANWPFLAPWDPVRPDAFFTPAGQEARISGMLADRAVYPCAIELDGDVVGTITLTQIEYGPAQSANLGYWVAQAVNGRGVATKAVAEIVEHAFGVLGLHRIQAGTLAHNHGSQKVLANNGFERIGTARGFLFIEGRWQDHILFQLVNDDWQPA